MVRKEKEVNEKKDKISIVILNWNGWCDTEECLKSLQELNYTEYEIIIVDNGSVDDSVKKIRTHFPEVILIENKENIGFTGGNNQGMQYALDNGAKYIVLLNNDTVVDKNLLTEMHNQFKEDPRVGLVGPKVVYYDTPDKIWCAGGHYNSILGKGKMYGTYSKKMKNFDKANEVDWISFCVVMIKAEVCNKIGLLDDDLFFTSEDLEFCRRAVRNRYTCSYTPKTKVYHKVSQDSGGLDSPLNIYYQVRNTLLFYRKERSTIGFLISLMYYLGVSLPKRSMVFLANGYMSRTKFMLYGVLDFFRGETGKGRLSGKIIKELKELKIRKEEKQDKNKRCLRIGINARYLENPETGIEKYLRFLVNNLVMIDKKNDYVLFYRNNSSSRIVESRKISEIKTGMGDWNVFCRIFYEQFLLWRDIKNEKVDIFHGPSFMVPFFKPKGCKYIVTIMDLSYLTCPESYTFLNRLYFHLFLKRSMTIADKIIAISESTKKEIMHNFRIHADKIVVTHLAVEEKYKLIKDNEKRINVQRKYGLPEKFMLCVGSLIPRKNIKRIIEAFKKIKGDGLPHKLVVVGKKGWLYDDIFHYIDEHNLKEDIHFTGYVGYDDLPVIYCLADLFVYPSLEEGFGLPILEAFACECPVLTSNTSSMPEVAGDAAYLINPLSIDEIADGMKEMLTNKKLRVQLIKKGKGRVNDFSWKMAAEKTLNTYIKL